MAFSQLEDLKGLTVLDSKHVKQIVGGSSYEDTSNTDDVSDSRDTSQSYDTSTSQDTSDHHDG